MTSENSVALVTNTIASVPARSCTRRQDADMPAETCGIALVAMNTATQTIACRAITNVLR